MQRLLAGLTVICSIGFAIESYYDVIPVYFPILGLLVALLLLASDGVFGTRFRAVVLIQYLMGLSCASYLLLGGAASINGMKWLPEWMSSYWPPDDSAIVAATVVLINYIISLVPAIRTIVNMVNPYFEDGSYVNANLGILGVHRVKERNLGFILFGIILFLNIAQVYLTVQFSFWYNRFYTALQDKDVRTFWVEIVFFSVAASLWVLRYAAEVYITALFKINWRRWLTDRYVSDWLNDKNHYRIIMSSGMADNPDQRISEDVDRFVDKTNDWYVLFFVTALGLYAYIRILWGISAQFTYNIGGFDLSSIPGFLVLVAFVLSAIATVGTHYIGRQLVGLNFSKQRMEANFRYSLMRVRENTEQIALLGGEANERTRLMIRFDGVFLNTLAIAMRSSILRLFTASYQQATVVVPFILLAPAYFTNPILKLGLLQQTRSAFGDVNDSFSFFVTWYQDLAEYRSAVNRLLGFDDAIVSAEAIRAKGISVGTNNIAAGIGAKDLHVTLPDGALLLDDVSLNLKEGQRTLVTGTSGSGKTTLFRAIAGIWPFGSGQIRIPEGESVMMLPQQAYMPLGTLRAALTYPSAEDAFSDAHIREGLAQVGLANLAEKLDTTENWSNALSGGEKQRVSIVRALLRRPTWLFLDEATSAVDEKTEAELYGLLRKVLPGTTVVSIGHRSSLARLHERRIDIVKDENGAQLRDASLEAFGNPA